MKSYKTFVKILVKFILIILLGIVIIYLTHVFVNMFYPQIWSAIFLTYLLTIGIYAIVTGILIEDIYNTIKRNETNEKETIILK